MAGKKKEKTEHKKNKEKTQERRRRKQKTPEGSSAATVGFEQNLWAVRSRSRPIRRCGLAQGCDDRLRVGPGRVAAPRPQQGAARGGRDLAQRFRDPKDPFRVVIVRDMWFTGFDAPSLHTMYVDKPMRGLMQAIARVDRVFKDKPGGLVVDYLGLADELMQALATYTEAGGTGETALDQAEAVAVMLEKIEVCAGSSTASTGAGGPAGRRRIACRSCPPPRSTSSPGRTASSGCFSSSPSCRGPSHSPCRTRWPWPSGAKEKATQTVLEQAEVLSEAWAAVA